MSFIVQPAWLQLFVKRRHVLSEFTDFSLQYVISEGNYMLLHIHL